jgi:hypothetical protein
MPSPRPSVIAEALASAEREFSSAYFVRRRERTIRTPAASMPSPRRDRHSIDLGHSDRPSSMGDHGHRQDGDRDSCNVLRHQAHGSFLEEFGELSPAP